MDRQKSPEQNTAHIHIPAATKVKCQCILREQTLYKTTFREEIKKKKNCQEIKNCLSTPLKMTDIMLSLCLSVEQHIFNQ